MDEPERQPARPASNRAFAEAVRGNAFSLLIGGGICLYFGFTVLLDAPGSASEEAAEFWYTLDRVFQWALRIIGALFLVAAAWALTGQRTSMLLAALAEIGFAMLMFAWTVETILEARADGGFDAFAILLGILAIIGISGAKRSWLLYTSMAGTAPFEGGDDHHPESPPG
jgi:hypothetical protein